MDEYLSREGDDTPVEALRRGLRVLEIVAGGPAGGVTAAELVRRSGLKATTVQNLVKTLCLCGFVARPARGIYAAGWRWTALLRADRAAGLLAGAFADRLRDLAAATGETVVLATLAPEGRRVIARVSGTQTVRVDSEAADAARDPFWSRVTGRVLAAFSDGDERAALLRREGMPRAAWNGIDDPAHLAAALDAVRSVGAALDSANEVASLAVPVLGPDSRLLAALGLYLPAYRWNAAARTRLLAACRTAATADANPPVTV